MFVPRIHHPFQFLLLLLCLHWPAPAQTPPARSRPLRPEDTPALPAEPEEIAADTVAEPAKEEVAPSAEPEAPPVHDWLEVQVELARRGFSCGSIDGVRGAQSAAALSAFQRNEGLHETGVLDQATTAALCPYRWFESQVAVL